jgi:hypothetical protein
MSYNVSIRRLIQKQEFLGLIQNQPAFRVESQDEDCAIVEWVQGEEITTFVLSQATIDATTPSEAAYEKMTEMAEKLNAEVIGEEEKFIVPRSSAKSGVVAGRSTWIGWPVLVIVLIVLLIWRW